VEYGADQMMRRMDVLDSEATLLATARQGDPQAFSGLVELYQTPVYNGDAEDAAQETFLRAYKSMKKYDKSRSFATWLMSIAAHYCIDQLRKRRMKIISTEDLPYFEVVDGNPGPESIMAQSQEQDGVRKLLHTLNPIDRAAVIMYYWNELSYQEISQTLDLTESAVKSRLHRARRNLAQTWIDQQQKIQAQERNHHGELQSPAF
jgi:RNA polymerase sigma-70 factor (ECF subfamily)